MEASISDVRSLMWKVSQQQLMRVYGALMWSLGKVFRSPEVCRVYIGKESLVHLCAWNNVDGGF